MSSNSRAYALPALLLLALVMLLASGCVDIEAELRLRRNGAARLTLQYSFQSELLSTGVFDSDGDLLPLPVARADFERSAHAIEGMRLRSYRRWADGDRIRVEARLAFDDIDALGRFWAPLAGSDDALELGGTDDTTTLRLPIFDPQDTLVGERGRSIGRAFLQGYDYRLTLRAPRSVRSLSQGSADGRDATLQFELLELIENPQPVWWEVSW